MTFLRKSVGETVTNSERYETVKGKSHKEVVDVTRLVTR